MKNILPRLILIGVIFPITSFANSLHSQDDAFRQMESAGLFKQIKANFVGSCYSKSASEVPTAKVNLKKLQAQHPDRITVCTCFERELSSVSNRVIYEDSQKAFQLMQEMATAKQNKDAQKIKELAEKAKKHKPTIEVIVDKCEAR